VAFLFAIKSMISASRLNIGKVSGSTPLFSTALKPRKGLF
jgi:hypothetical protein